LSWETLEGLAKHNGPVAAPEWALQEADAEFGLDLASWPSLEAQVAAIADDIAYDNHDIDDGLRAGIIELEELLELPMVARLWTAIDARHPGLDTSRKVKALVRDGIGTMVGDVLDETRRRVANAGVATIDGVRGCGRQLAGFSDSMQVEERKLKQFLYERLYNSPALQPVRVEAQRVITNLAGAYRADPALLPEGWAGDGEAGRLRGIADYIAGMTDGFAIARHEKLVGPVHLPDRF
jgi:dGTPase